MILNDEDVSLRVLDIASNKSNEITKCAMGALYVCPESDWLVIQQYEGQLKEGQVGARPTHLYCVKDVYKRQVQLYTAKELVEQGGKGGITYGNFGGLCFETQQYPNGINEPKFPSPILKAGETFESTTVFRFGIY